MLDFNKNEEEKDKMSDVVCEVIAQLPTKYGTFEAHGYVDQRNLRTSCSTGQRRYRRRRTSFMPCAF